MSTTLSIRTTESQPFVLLPTFVNGKGPFEFVLDTGAAMSVMTEELASMVGVQDTAVKEALGAAGKRIKVLLGKVDSIAIGQSKVENAQIAIMKDLPKCVGHGVIGHNFLKRYVLTIDYRSNMLTLVSPGGEKSGDDLLEESLPFRIARPDRPIILLDVLVNGQHTYPFVLDTGASQTVVSPQLAQQMGVRGAQVGSMLGAGGSIQSSVGTLKSLTIGKVRLEDVTIVVSDIFAALGQALGATISGILGYNVLSKFKLVIDYPAEILRFEQ